MRVITIRPCWIGKAYRVPGQVFDCADETLVRKGAAIEPVDGYPEEEEAPEPPPKPVVIETMDERIAKVRERALKTGPPKKSGKK